MKRNTKTAQTTADGTSTLLSAQYGAHYHSLHGALTESLHIYIEAGLMASPKKSVSVLEVGFGTGLNAALTAQRATIAGFSVTYHSLELHPLSGNEYELLNYAKQLPAEAATLWQLICNAEWGRDSRINEFFTIRKINADFTQWVPLCNYDIVYFDAFAPDDQPEMWSVEQFQKIYDAMPNRGILVTYSVKGVVKRTLAQVGFTLERLVGPPGKKHMLRAFK
jgi:tRNA U34 5-methylaminomethyl-2-thiouridine-forming methyltransferase MnmC